MLTTILFTLYASGFAMLFLLLILFDDEKDTFLAAMIKLAGIIFWPIVLVWYLLESAGLLRPMKRTDAPDAPVEHDSWL